MITHGLKKTTEDARDLKVGQLFSLPPLSSLPLEYEVESTSYFKEQKNTDYCAAEAAVAISEDQEAVELDPLWQFMKAKLIEGDPNGFGLELRSAAKSCVDFGSLEKQYSPFTVDAARSVIVDPNSWKDMNYDRLAIEHKKGSYLFVVGPYDFFDNIRATLWYFKNEKRSIEMGFDWCSEWIGMPGGVIDSVGTFVSGHAVKIKGYVQKNGKTYLKAQLSSGKEVGDNGYFYFSREVVNAQKGYGAFTFSDYEKDFLKYHQSLGVKADLPFALRWIKIITSYIISLWQN